MIEILNQEGKINIDNKFINTLKITKAEEMHENIIKIRESLQYGVELEFKEKGEFDRLNDMCKEIINETREIIHESSIN